MTQVLISVGSNQNGPETQVIKAFHSLSQIGVDIKMSSLFLTEPVGPISQASFVNAVITFETNFTAPEVLQILLDIEIQAGRDRNNETPKGPRILDLDIILFGTEIWSDETLQIPHPRYHTRRFVLEPAAELSPDFIDPVSQQTIAQTLANCSDTSWIKPLEQKEFVV